MQPPEQGQDFHICIRAEVGLHDRDQGLKTASLASGYNGDAMNQEPGSGSSKLGIEPGAQGWVPTSSEQRGTT